jgi:multidrug resistance protein MdtO
MARGRSMSGSSLLEFLRRELAPTPGRGGATFRLTLACLAATIPILTHRIPHGLIVLIVMYLITQEDTVATLIGSILGIIGVTIGLGAALLAWEISLDIEWLRIVFFIVFFFGGLFLKRVLTIGALGSAIGIPAGLVMILPDIYPPDPELLVEFVLWIWWCVTLGLSVNLGVQLLLSPGDPLMLLRRELDTRLQAVADLLRRFAGSSIAQTATADSLNSLVTAGMSRPLALLKTSSLIHSWARARHEKLSALITLLDRLVTAATALQALAPGAVERVQRERLLNAAEGCERMRRAFAEMRLPALGEWTALASEQTSGELSPLADIERTLDQIALAVPEHEHDADKSVPAPAEKRSLFLPDAFANPEYVRFAIKGTLAAFICYFLFIGFDYPGIYTSVITCFVISLSTIGASNQKGILRFGGAAVGGLMGLIALVYLFPHFETIGGFWLVFGAGTAVAAWATFGTPRIFYGGYQTGLAFYKAILQNFGPALSATVVRDRLIGVFFGLIVFGIVEHVLWPVSARDALRARLTEMLRLLADLARSGTRSTIPAAIDADVDSWRRRISQKVEEIQGHIESSKFEPDDFRVSEIQQITGDAQIVFILMLSLARQRYELGHMDMVRAATLDVDNSIATALEALATRGAPNSQSAVLQLDDRLNSLERSTTDPDALDQEAAAHFAARLALYRALVAAINRLSSGISEYWTRQIPESLLERGAFFESRETRTN